MKPQYDFENSNSKTLIYSSKSNIDINGKEYHGHGEIFLELFPRAGIYAYGYFSDIPVGESLGIVLGQVNISSFSINNQQLNGFRLSSGGNAASQTFNIKWCPSSEPVEIIGSDNTDISYVIFHIFNFVDLLGTRITNESSATTKHRIEHVDLDCDDWNVELKSLLATRKNINKLKEEGGYKITHIGKIKNKIEPTFSGKSAKQILHSLRYFLSFAKGGWCEPVCAVGFDDDHNVVWQSWSSPREPWHSPLSWFDPHNSSQLVKLFPEFMAKCKDDDWSKSLHEVIYWYLNANYSSRGVDAGIILTQAAIEKLSYEYVVKEKRLITPKGFKDLWASDKFRLLFSSLNIPLEIPPETTNLQNLSKQHNWLDAPHGLTEIRNSLVHSDHKKSGQFDTAYYEAWNLGLWYLEMGLLAICKYDQIYGNRLKQRWVGQTEKTPWS